MLRRSAINEESGTLEEVQVAKACAPTREGSTRFHALELLLRGFDEENVAEIFDVSVRTIERWRGLFNGGGISAVAVRSKTGRPRKITPEEFQAKVSPLLQEPSQANETHWTCVKLHGYLTDTLKKEVGYSTLLRYLHEEGYSTVVPRKWPAQQDEERRKEFLSIVRELHGQPDTQIWFCAESGFEGDPRPRRIWAKRGSKPKVPYNGNHLRANVIGAVQPDTGAFHSLVFPSVDRDVFQAFLDTFATLTKNTEKKIVLVLDNASWHKEKSLHWHHILRWTPKSGQVFPNHSPCE